MGQREISVHILGKNTEKHSGIEPATRQKVEGALDMSGSQPGFNFHSQTGIATGRERFSQRSMALALDARARAGRKHLHPSKRRSPARGYGMPSGSQGPAAGRRSERLVIGRWRFFLQGNKVAASILVLRRRICDFHQLIVDLPHARDIFRGDDRGAMGVIALDAAS